MNQVRVLFFATLKERAGVRETTLELPESATVGDLKRLLALRFPDLAEALPSSLVALKREFAFDDDPVPAGVEAALFPPVSGG